MGMIPEIPELKDIIKDELAVRGYWIVANVETTIAWPVVAQKVVFGGSVLWVLPLTREHCPAVTVNCPNIPNPTDAQRLMMRFLSALSWIESGGIVCSYFSAGEQPRPMARQKTHGNAIRDDFDFSYLPEPPTEKGRLALALMREGRSLNHPAYAFLSFYKVLEVALPDGRKRGAWMTTHIDLLRDGRAKEAVTKLRANAVEDVGEHLQKSGRQAIAHASSHPVIDPDDPMHGRRLISELPIIGALAELAIEEELGVETLQTVWSKHLYELEGFKKYFGPELVAAISKGEHIDCTHAITLLPHIDVHLRRCNAYPSLTDMRPVSLHQTGSIATLTTHSASGWFGFRCHLDFGDERLHFDFEDDLAAVDDESAECADMHADLHRFIRDYLSNGELRLTVSRDNALLSRKEAFIPMNCFVDFDACRRIIEKWTTTAERRRSTADL
jgi:hypothetical protein